MKVPKYIIDLMNRAKYNYDLYGKFDNYAAGYTIDIAKYSYYEYASTFQKEIERLIKWCNRQFADVESAYILKQPKITEHKRMQYATVTIYDPVMKYIEQYIPTEIKGGN